MSTEYYLKFLPERDLEFDISKKVRKSLIEDHKLTRIIEILNNELYIENETVKVINKGVRGPYADGYYCGFVFDEEFEFWEKLIGKYPTNGLLNIIFAEYLVQKDKSYDRANRFYKKGFDIDFRLIGFIEPSWLDELTDKNFDFRLVYLRLQKEQYEPEDFGELIDFLKNKYKGDKDKISEIDKINAS
jgi:hypothetical protein